MDSNQGPFAYQPNALPPGQTGSHFFQCLGSPGYGQAVMSRDGGGGGGGN